MSNDYPIRLLPIKEIDGPNFERLKIGLKHYPASRKERKRVGHAIITNSVLAMRMKEPPYHFLNMNCKGWYFIFDTHPVIIGFENVEDLVLFKSKFEGTKDVVDEP